MPTLGEIKKARDVGFNHNGRVIWAACITCGNERWVRIRYKPSGIGSENAHCRSCGKKRAGQSRCGAANVRWTGRRKNGAYLEVWLSPDDFFYPMAKKDGYIWEHRLVMAKSLGRCLQAWEIIHHKNGIKDDNRLENLELSTMGSHIVAHNKGYQDGYLKGLLDGREQQIKELKSEIKLLQWQIMELRQDLIPSKKEQQSGF